MFILLFTALERVGDKISERLQLLPERKHPYRPAYLRAVGALLSFNARTGLSRPPGLGSLTLLNVYSLWDVTWTSQVFGRGWQARSHDLPLSP
jgi:hypothetical protein